MTPRYIIPVAYRISGNKKRIAGIIKLLFNGWNEKKSYALTIPSAWFYRGKSSHIRSVTRYHRISGQ